MALIQVNYMSRSLMRTVPVHVILPVDKFSDNEKEMGEEKPFKTLYLLHGVLGNYTDWVSGTRIQRWAEEKNLAVVMPSGDNAFYIDQKEKGSRYGEFIGKELVEITRRMFPLSRKREDTFIGGLSMGGYGAIRNGLKYYDTFGWIIGLSSALHMFEHLEDIETGAAVLEWNVWGDLKEAAKTDNNPRVLLEQLKEIRKINTKVEFPKIFMACGTEDFLLEDNRIFRDLFKESGVDLTYIEEPGGHEWDFWDRMIKKGLDWLPLGEGIQGINSGNVHG